MFVGRERELAAMEKLYAKDKFQFVALYGRRRVGKTTLITKFIEGKPAIFYTAREANDKINLAELSRQIYRFFAIPEVTGPFQSWDDAFSFLADQARRQRFILAFDEFPYAANENRALRSILQNAIDHRMKDTGLFLILCGSQISFMENEVLGYKSPLFGRRTARIKMEGLDYYDAASMLTGFTREEQIQFYGCVGGTPHYLAQADPDESFAENIRRLYFDISGYLYNEPTMLIQQELREPSMYNSIISAIAAGATRVSDIANRIGEDNSKVSKYLKTLIELRVVAREYPFGEDPETSRRSIYKLADNCYLFWYRFVFPAQAEIESGNGGIIASRLLSGERLPAFLGKPAFEEICLQFLRRLSRAGRLPFAGTSFGSWWGNDPREKRQNDIDVIMADRETRQILLGECKWQNEPPSGAAIEGLLGKDYLLPRYQRFYHCFFSKAPFGPAARRLRKDSGVLLFDLADLFLAGL
ncbi:MAG: ATP-binding protein [Peptococcaceae bacterium]|jgi:AAA+ ATPase superfamily predicted ATPase|nr:ATP-binding protein [Peptococcaceae bacterium]